MTTPLLVNGVARAANWALTALLAANAALSLPALGVNWLGAAVGALYLVVALGTLWRVPAAYLIVAGVSFFALAASMQSENFALAVVNGAVFALALFIRSQLRIPRAPT